MIIELKEDNRMTENSIFVLWVIELLQKRDQP